MSPSAEHSFKPLLEENFNDNRDEHSRHQHHQAPARMFHPRHQNGFVLYENDNCETLKDDSGFRDNCGSLSSSDSGGSAESIEEGRGVELMNEDFSHRPSYTDAALALTQVRRGKAKGFIPALYVRALMQRGLFRWGQFVQSHAGGILFVGILILCLFCVGLRHVYIETNIEKLWVEKGGRLDEEKTFIRSIIEEQGVDYNNPSYQVVIQTPLQGRGANILTKADLLVHVEMMRNISTMTLDMYGQKWQLQDICFRPEPPKLEGDIGAQITEILYHIIPCVIISPLDCFFEGSKPLGPFPDYIPPDIISGMPGFEKGYMNWKIINPNNILTLVKTFDNLIEDHESINALFDRAGIKSAYQQRPCIDPFDPECPETSPNYRNATKVDYGQILSKGCRGFADNLMKWQDDLIIGGITRERGIITKAEALQSVMLVLPPGVLHRRFVENPKPNWQNESWTVDAADQLLLAWQRNFSQLIYNTPFNQLLSARKIYYDTHDSVTASYVPTTTLKPTRRPTTAKGRPVTTAETVAVQTSTVGNESRNSTRTKREIKGESSAALIRRKSPVPPMFHPLSGTSVNDMLSEFSQFKPDMIIIGYCLMLVYAALSLISCKGKGVQSSVGLSIFGCVLVTFATTAGLGCSTLLGIQFNAATTQIVPFLTLGLGVDDMFLLVYNYQELNRITRKDELGYLLKETGLSVLLTSVNNILAFMTGVLLPVPALRSFCLQVMILLVFNFVAIITIFPAMMSLDLIRRRDKRVDIFCCVQINNDKVRPTSHNNNNGHHIGHRKTGSTAKLIDPPLTYDSAHKITSSLTSSPTVQNGNANGAAKLLNGTVKNSSQKNKIFGNRHLNFHKCSLHYFINHFYAPLLSRLPVKIVVVVVFVISLAIGIVGVTQIQLGLEMTDIVPKDTAPYDFLSAREDYFSFYTMNAVIRDNFDYPLNQQLLHRYREEMSNVSYVVKQPGESGQGGPFWLSLMAKWLKNIQKKYDEELKTQPDSVSLAGVKCHGTAFKVKNDDTILAYRLLVSSGDKVNRSRFGHVKLIDDNGVINAESFWNIVTAWYHIDAISYYVSQANFFPIPQAKWNYVRGVCRNNLTDAELLIPKAEPLRFSQIPYYLTGLTGTETIVNMLTEVRSVSEKYAGLGLPNFPEGIPFTFWEQYVRLSHNLLVCLCLITAAVFIVITLLLMSPWTAAIIASVLVMVVVELGGFMGIIGLKLNPVSAVTLITAVGIGVEFTVHVCFSYLTALGTANERMAATLDHMFIPVLHGGLSTLLGVIMLAFSEFEFIVRYFFVVMAALIVIGLFNGLMLLPVLLSLLGPKPEVQPLGGLRYLNPPTPDGGKKSSDSRSDSGRGGQLETTNELLHHRQTVKTPPLAESEYDYQPAFATQTPPIGGLTVTIHSRPALFRRQMSDEISLSTISEENNGGNVTVPVVLSGGALTKTSAQTSKKDMTLALTGSPKSPTSNAKVAKAEAHDEGAHVSPMAVSASIDSFETDKRKKTPTSGNKKRRRWSSSGGGQDQSGQDMDPLLESSGVEVEKRHSHGGYSASPKKKHLGVDSPVLNDGGILDVL